MKRIKRTFPKGMETHKNQIADANSPLLAFAKRYGEARRGAGGLNFFLILTALFFFSFAEKNFAQKQYNVWYFGGAGGLGNNALPGAGIDFNSGSPVALTNSAMGFTEGCAVYCNNAGQLLFYTQGDTVWNRNHQIMPNGAGLGGHFSSVQSSVIVPVKSNANKYYLFSNDGVFSGNGTGLHYSLIDMTLDGGLGDIVSSVKGISLLPSTAEKVTAVRHANGCDYWVITTLDVSNVYYAYRITSTRIVDTVITTIGPVDNVSGTQFKASPLSNQLSTTGDQSLMNFYTILLMLRKSELLIHIF